MRDEELQTALEHDQARRNVEERLPRSLVLAAECMRTAAIASRTGEMALTACHPADRASMRKSAHLAIASLEQALILIGMEQTSDE